MFAGFMMSTWAVATIVAVVAGVVGRLLRRGLWRALLRHRPGLGRAAPHPAHPAATPPAQPHLLTGPAPSPLPLPPRR